MWSMILLMSRLPGGHSMPAGRRSEKARLPTVTVNSLLVYGTTRRSVSIERSDRRLGRSATRVKGPRYPGASPHVNSLTRGTSSWPCTASRS